MITTDLSFHLFVAMNALRVFSYLPQIWRVAVDRHGASAISYSCWSIWTGANAATASYALVNLGDVWLGVVSLSNTAGCLTVITLTWVKRRRWRVRMAEASLKIT